jgi:S-adenosylmethionine hydrolase
MPRHDGRVPAAWISFLSDYGLDDGFVAACHGVVARIAADARVIDITHLVPPQDVRRGAAVLAEAVPHLPAGVHLAVVDPGVGTQRRPVAVQSGGRVFVGPDNGLLGWALTAVGGADRAVELTEPAYGLRGAAVTFDGRDVFAPAAAHLAHGVPLAGLGPSVDPATLIALPAPAARARQGRLDTEVLTVDRFGNVVLAGRADDLAALGSDVGVTVAVELGHDRSPAQLGRTFADAPAGELVAYADSGGHPALAVNGGDAASRLGLRPGDRVALVAPP